MGIKIYRNNELNINSSSPNVSVSRKCFVTTAALQWPRDTRTRRCTMNRIRLNNQRERKREPLSRKVEAVTRGFSPYEYQEIIHTAIIEHDHAPTRYPAFPRKSNYVRGKSWRRVPSAFHGTRGGLLLLLLLLAVYLKFPPAGKYTASSNGSESRRRRRRTYLHTGKSNSLFRTN